MAALTRVAYTVSYLAVAAGLGFLVLAVWWMFAAVALEEFCEGLTTPCGSAGRFTSDYWWVIVVAAAALSAVALYPVYRRLIRWYSE